MSAWFDEMARGWRVMVLAVLGLLLALPAAANGLTDNDRFIWARAFGSGASDRSQAMVVDAAGYSYLTGRFAGTLDVATSGPSTPLSAQGSSSIFVLKVDPYGETVWARAFGGEGHDEGTAIAVDADGNVLVGGLFEDSVEFEPGPGGDTLTSNGFGDAFVLKLGPEGEYLWVRGFGGAGYDQIFGIGTDAAGNVYTAGVFTGQADFDPATTEFLLTAAGGSLDRDVFASKFAPNGNFLGAVSVGGPQAELCLDMAVDPNGNMYIVGAFSGIADFEPDPNNDPVVRTSGGALDGFVLKLDTNGELGGLATMQSTGSVINTAVAIDSNGDVLVTGSYEDTVFLGSDQLGSLGSTETFVTKLSNNANFIWAVPIRSTGYIEPNAIAVDAQDNIYLTGRFSGDASVDAFDFSTALFEANWIARLDENGAADWVRTLTGDAGVVGFGIGVDALGSVYTAGSFQEETDLNPGGAQFSVSPQGDEDFFLLKLGDDTLPNAVAITPAVTGPTNAESVDFTVAFDKEVFLFDDPANIEVLHDGTSHQGIAIDGGPIVYTVRVEDIAGDGGFALRVNTGGVTRDAIGNRVGSSVVSDPVRIDNTPPNAISVEPIGGDPANATSRSFRALFDEAVTGFDDSALVITLDGTAVDRAVVTGSGDDYTVTLNGVSGEGSVVVGIEMPSTIADVAGNLLATAASSEPVVVDTVPPVLTLNGPASLAAEAGEPFVDPGASAIDGLDGDLTAEVLVSGAVDPFALGVYELEYNVADAAGNAAAPLTRTVTVLDTTPPIITLVGEAAVFLVEGDAYSEPGATALDSFEGDLSANVVITGTVDTETLGVYEIFYDVADSSGNQAATVTRTVTVLSADAPDAPVITTDGGNGPGVDFDTPLAMLTLEGTAGAGTEELRLNGAPVPYTPGSPVWSIALDLAVLGPEASLAVTAVNAAAIESVPATIVIKYDPTLSDEPVEIVFAGALRDAVTLEALSCAVIELTPTGVEFQAVAVTDSIGQFFFEPLPAGLYAVRVLAPGYETQFPEPVLLDEEAFVSQDFFLVPRAATSTVSGHVVDGETRLPLVGATAELFVNDAFAAETLTCADGRYELLLPGALAKDDAVDIAVVFSLENYEAEVAEETVDPAEGVTVSALLFKSVPGPSAIVGSVFTKLSGDTAPLEGARVTLTGPINTSATTTDTGAYAVPEVLAGQYTVTASAPGHHSHTILRTLAAMEVREATFQLEPLETDPLPPLPGDVNGDGVVNAIDVQLVINAALGVAIEQSVNADINGDGMVNAIDVQLVINAALGLAISGD